MGMNAWFVRTNSVCDNFLRTKTREHLLDATIGDISTHFTIYQVYRDFGACIFCLVLPRNAYLVALSL